MIPIVLNCCTLAFDNSSFSSPSSTIVSYLQPMIHGLGRASADAYGGRIALDS